MVILIGGSFAISYLLISNINFDIITWIGVAVMVSIAELIICSTVFVLIKPRMTLNMAKKIKSKFFKK